jgi:hypothetical protein
MMLVSDVLSWVTLIMFKRLLHRSTTHDQYTRRYQW